MTDQGPNPAWRPEDGRKRMCLGRSVKMIKMIVMHSREIGLARHPVGVGRNGHEWAGVRSTPDSCSDFLQPGGTLMAIPWGRRSGHSDSAWSARGRIGRHCGCAGPGPVTLLARRDPYGDDAADRTGAPSCRNDRARTVVLAQLAPHHFPRTGRRSALRPLIVGTAAITCDVRVAPGASMRLAPCVRTDGAARTMLLGGPSPGRVAKGRLR